MLTILRSPPNLSLAKIWARSGEIISAANVAWFEAMEVEVNELADFIAIIGDIERDPHRAIVKEAIASGADPKRLRRRCVSDVDSKTGECYPAGLEAIERNWVLIDVDGLERPTSIDYRDGGSLAAYVRSLLPDCFKSATCVWQLSGSSGHATKINQIRMHMFFMCDTYIWPKSWNKFLGHLSFVDTGIYDNAKLIFTAAPIIHGATDPISQRHGMLSGASVVCVPTEIIKTSNKIAAGEDTPRALPIATIPMPEAAAAFVDIIAESNVLRSQHPAYQLDRSRRLAFCSMLRWVFGITDETSLTSAFKQACVGSEDRNADHDAGQALSWALGPPRDRTYSLRKLLCDAAVALREAGKVDLARKAAHLAHYFWKHETGAEL